MVCEWLSCSVFIGRESFRRIEEEVGLKWIPRSLFIYIRDSACPLAPLLRRPLSSQEDEWSRSTCKGSLLASQYITVLSKVCFIDYRLSSRSSAPRLLTTFDHRDYQSGGGDERVRNVCPRERYIRISLGWPFVRLER
jgi:hypothetical protein